jgi:hypothetical protein
MRGYTIIKPDDSKSYDHVWQALEDEGFKPVYRVQVKYVGKGSMIRTVYEKDDKHWYISNAHQTGERITRINIREVQELKHYKPITL